ncbi:hypothetical protein DBR11_27710 [Pedobacter sp. HMWF019]|uniref:AhpC/TSA family protein n=1 Tax=Pedobacter sp. HMWF019 TaxID=2056856 RepID=UPI000D337901|nr:AhpC/TSA family protein [Pedobacter sp. HMWF019]PTS91989.1 hypothetical protein DBR11_27710 [Pedobacter sp. HMWF019]
MIRLKKIKKYLVPKVFFVAAMICSSASVHGQSSGSYVIDGHIEGLDSGKVFLSATYQGKNLTDSVVVKNGSFSFKGNIPGTLLYGLRFGKQHYITVVVQPNEEIRVKGNLTNLDNVEISGAKEQKVWEEWMKVWTMIRNQAGRLYKMADSIGKGDRTAVDAGFEQLNLRLVDSVEAFVRRHPSSAIAPFVITDRFVNYPNPEKAQSNYAVLTSAGKNTIYGKELGQAISVNAKTGVGVRPDFTLPDREGKSFKLSSLKGKLVLVDFWASWCGPCRKENPNLVKAYEKYHSQGFEIVGVSLDDKKEAWIKAIDADKLTWIHVSDLKGWKSNLAKEYGIRSIPTNFLVDRNGKIIAKDLRGEALEKKLSMIYK